MKVSQIQGNRKWGQLWLFLSTRKRYDTSITIQNNKGFRNAWLAHSISSSQGRISKSGFSGFIKHNFWVVTVATVTFSCFCWLNQWQVTSLILSLLRGVTISCYRSVSLWRVWCRSPRLITWDVCSEMPNCIFNLSSKPIIRTRNNKI